MPSGCKTSLNHHPSTPVLNRWYGCFYNKAVFAVLCFGQAFLLCLICSKVIVPEVFLLLQMLFCKPEPNCHILFNKRKISPEIPFKHATVVQYFCNGLSWTLTFNMLRPEEVKVEFWGFCDLFLSIAWALHFFLNLSRHLLLGVFAFVLTVFYFSISFLTVLIGSEHWCRKGLEFLSTSSNRKNWFFMIFANYFLSWHCVTTALKT